MKFQQETSAGGIVYKREGDNTVWLVTQHSQNKHWSFPKGLIGDKMENEKKEEAALREVGEEGGVTARIVNDKPVAIHYMYRHKDTVVKKTVYYFLMEYISGDPQNHDWEVEEAKFLLADEVKELVTFKTDQEAFKKILTIYRRNG